MENLKDSNCCSPSDSAENSNCCAPTASKKSKKIKNRIGLGVLGLAVILATTSAFTAESCDLSADGISCKESSIESFKWSKNTGKVVFVLLKGENNNENLKISEEVKTVINEINDGDKTAFYKELEPGSKDFKTLIEKENIKTFPAIVVMGKNAKTTVLGGKLNTLKLIRAYDVAATAICGPADKTSCCTKK